MLGKEIKREREKEKELVDRVGMKSGKVGREAAAVISGDSSETVIAGGGE